MAEASNKIDFKKQSNFFPPHCEMRLSLQRESIKHNSDFCSVIGKLCIRSGENFFSRQLRETLYVKVCHMKILFLFHHAMAVFQHTGR